MSAPQIQFPGTNEMTGREPRLLIDALYSFGGDGEDRLTEVLAVAMKACVPFCRSLLADLGLDLNPTVFAVRTQVGRPGHRRLVDLMLQGFDQRGIPVVTVFLENKYNPDGRDRPYWFSQDQYERQRAALNRQPSELRLVGVCSDGDLERLAQNAPEVRRGLEYDPRADYDSVIGWNRVVEIAKTVAAAAAVTSDSVGERMLHELITYCEREGGEVGALTNDDLFVLAKHAQTRGRVEDLLYAAGQKLAGTLAPDLLALEFGETEDDYSATDENSGAVRTWVSTAPPEKSWAADRRDCALFLMIAGSTYGQDDQLGTPTIYAGVSWNAGRAGKHKMLGSSWERAAHRQHVELHWFGTTCDAVAALPLQDLVDGASTTEKQAHRLADWAQEQFETILALPEPPDKDE